MTQKDYTALVDRTKQLSFEYYVMSRPSVSDAEFDAIVSEIEQAEQQHPEWTLADSPTQAVGSDLQANGRRWIRHRTKMLSCQKAQTREAVTAWLKKARKAGAQDYALEWKMDGISCSLVYQDGILVSAATRGDKERGQDLLSHVSQMASVPQEIAIPGRIEVRGEIVCPKRQLARLGYKDCRTAASALCNQVEPSADLCWLEFVAWQMIGGEATTETRAIAVLRNQGFTADAITVTADGIGEALDGFERDRDGLSYPTDGVVIKIDDMATATSMGCTAHHPKGNIAYKFAVVEKRMTRVLSVEVNVGETGRRTPVAMLEPVVIMGREVKSVSLGSERTCQELGVTDGCLVEVGLSNDVTPKIYRVISEPAAVSPVTEPENNQADEEPTIEAPAIEPADTPAPIETNASGEIADPRDAQIAELQARIAELEQQATVAPVIESVAHQASTAPAETPAPVAVATPQPTERERNAARRRQRREAREAQQRSYEDRLAREAREAEEYARQQERRKIFAATAAAAVTIVLIYFFGLLGPAIFGLLAGGLLKG